MAVRGCSAPFSCFFGGNSFFLIINIFSFMKIIIGCKDKIYSLVYIVLDYIEDEETGFEKTMFSLVHRGTVNGWV